MDITISSPSGTEELTEFLTFQDRVNEASGAWWPAMVPMQLPTLLGEGPGAIGRRFVPLIARTNGEVVARVLAVVDERYLERWDEPLGHTTMFEAMPDSVDAVRKLMDEAGAWLREQGMEAARAGFGLNDFPFLLDAYGTLAPVLVRQNPSYYHTLLKEAGYESEKGWVDYKVAVTPELVARWETFLSDVRARGFDIVPLGDVPEDRRVVEFNETWNDAFRHHWGVTTFSTEEHAELFETLGPMGMFDCSVIAYQDGEPVGVLWVAPEIASFMATTSGRELRDDEKLNFLGIGVREQARGKGVNVGMAAYAYLELVARGAKYLSYTLVLDDNWPSRRTAEKLGASVCANYMVYRRNFKRS